MTLLAQCSNCASWRTSAPVGGHVSTGGMGFCHRGLFPAQGELLCAKYEVSSAFKNEIISSMLKEHGPMAMPVKIMGGKRGKGGKRSKR